MMRLMRSWHAVWKRMLQGSVQTAHTPLPSLITVRLTSSKQLTVVLTF